MCETPLDDPDAELRSELAAAMPIQSRQWVNQVRRVGYDEVERSCHMTLEIALDDLHFRHIIEHGVDVAEA